ncbi:TolC family protein [Enterovirga sp. DB1703]|uniref:TolC family protein n=2 Tax=Enterovirga aerilata TaxID=2730920 RepID=A0A849I3B1_9HYPH|nr:TolC family protein [Enterovirga sp. DB1703]
MEWEASGQRSRDGRKRGARTGLAHLAGASAMALLLAGCARFSEDAGLSTARNVAAAELGTDIVKVTNQAEAVSAQERAEQLIRRPLTPDSAVQIAILKNRGLQASFNDLGVAEAVYVQATLPPPLTISASKFTGNLSLEIERQIIIGLFELATLPARAAIAERRFEAARYRTAEAVLRVGLEARRQFYRTVAANQQVAFLQQALASAESASTLAKQLGETGALNKLEQAREHAFYVELGAQLARARIQQGVERERLVRQLGLYGRDVAFRLPSSLPPLPSRLQTAREIERQALEQRVDLKAMRTELTSLAGQFGLTSAIRFVNDFELGLGDTYEREKTVTVAADGDVEVERDRVRRRGFEVEFRIPLYDFGASAVRNAEQTYMAAANRLAERAVNARSEAREAYLRYRGNHELARYYQGRVLPLRKTIQDESLLQYSGMLIDVTRLIIDARARILSNVDAINARRDFWLAATDLKGALVGGGAGGAGGGGEGGSPAAAGGGEAGGH